MERREDIKYSVLELAPVLAGGTPRDSFDNSVTLARHVEKLGYNRFWLAEHHNMISIASAATVVLIGHIAGATESIRVGSGGIMLPNHSPLIVSEQFGTLAQLYPGRIDLGLGRAPGTDQATAHAIRPDRIQAVHQFPREIEQIQDYFSPENAQAGVRATMAEGVDVPIYVLGSSTDSAYLAAEKGLPYVFASHFAPTHLFEALNIYYNNFKPSEYLSEPYTVAGVNIVAAATDEEADRLSTSMIRMMLGVLTNKMDYLQPPIDMTPEIRELVENPAFQRMMKYAFVGSKDTVKEKTAQFLKETGVNELIVTSNIYDIKDRLKSFTIFSQVMQELNMAEQNA
ncbi:LLM class flavin-dependent oxidoreductase [Fulvivirga maritima]|uniref:LLM class flavin-dependent oxidoreductase n=1 Tax=Fulvivirga maritima TaxID=2904247 RepID=UPI001F390DEB|nr:LLM class flavin-dependent oxidoreductase [Fulvivirga maritima]UII25048.1 LLM class flavin-dependent oxidoreductase [Fulvivirga maritima]